MATIIGLGLNQVTQGDVSSVALRLSGDVLRGIGATVGALPAETGGMLGGDPASGVVTHFWFDSKASRSGSTYSPDCNLLNGVLSREWNPNGVRLMGFVHSHPRGCRRPSKGDEIYARRILHAIPDLERLWLPIVIPRDDRDPFQLCPYAAVVRSRKVVIESARLVIVQATPQSNASFKSMNTFARVRTAYDLDRLQNARVVAVGCGGASEFLEQLVRAGVGHLVLIDSDTVSEPNLATQQTYRKDIGRAKVDAVAERLRDINPYVTVQPLHASSDDLSDDDFRELLLSAPTSGRAEVSVLCGMTDSFAAQARVNRLALKFCVPSLCAQVYFEGRGAELSFTHADTTGACHRCILSSRYRAYLQEGFQNTTTSDGTPIGSTGRLNSLKFFVAMALLHHGTGHPRWGNVLRRIGSRNLIQVRIDPDVALPVFDRVFQNADRSRIFCDETVWLPQLPDNPVHGHPTCPDCGGTGNLRDSFESIADTRQVGAEQ
jgi:hypothetical protein